MLKVLKRIDNMLEFINEYILIISGAAITLLIMAGAFLRYIFAINFKGSEEIIMMIGFWLYFVGSISAAREKSHLSADMMTLFTRNQKILSCAALVRDVLSLAVCALAIKWCYDYWCWTFPLHPVTSVYKIPMWIQQFPMVISFVIWGIYLVRDCCCSFLQLKNASRLKQNPDEEVQK